TAAIQFGTTERKQAQTQLQQLSEQQAKLNSELDSLRAQQDDRAKEIAVIERVVNAEREAKQTAVARLQALSEDHARLTTELEHLAVADSDLAKRIGATEAAI